MQNIALHFDFSPSAGALWDVPERIAILGRVLRAISPVTEFAGSAVIRMGMLFDSLRESKRDGAAWLEALRGLEVQVGSTHPAFKTEFENILVVVVSGPFEKLNRSALAKLNRARSYRFLFALRFGDQAVPHLRARYLSERTTLLGRFTSDREFHLSSEAMFFEEELQSMCVQLAIRATYTDAAYCGFSALLR